MVGRVIEIADNGRYLSLYRGFLVIKTEGEELGRVPLDTVAVLILSGAGNSISTQVVNALLEAGTMIIFCGGNYHPSAFIWPLVSHHQLTQRLQWQIEAGLPLKKRLWQALVTEKIQNQSATLRKFGFDECSLSDLALRVGSGDPENVESQAARKYWPALMGPEFRRDPAIGGTNGLLNYGYAVVRAAVARGVAAAGLHPALGIHHSNQSNPFCLVDDLLEPFRPLVDWTVRTMLNEGVTEVTPDTKRKLAGLLHHDILTGQGVSPLTNCLIRLGQSLARSLETNKAELDLPLSFWPEREGGED